MPIHALAGENHLTREQWESLQAAALAVLENEPRTLAAKRGVRYQTYLKMLLHEALAAEEKKLAS
jgi:hypothetical protein